METIKTLYQNERRALKLSLHNDNNSFDDITESFYSVYDNNDNEAIWPYQISAVSSTLLRVWMPINTISVRIIIAD